MISQLDLSKIQPGNQLDQPLSNDSGRNYEYNQTIQLIDIKSSSKLKISITILYILATTEKFKVEQSNTAYIITSKPFTAEILEHISNLIRIPSNTLLQAIEDIKNDDQMMNEISQRAFGVLNYIFKQQLLDYNLYIMGIYYSLNVIIERSGIIVGQAEDVNLQWSFYNIY
ncbi:Conserved_hypothetical protein [Hexamita inflata]|uniref:Uncharacterized protein n=1 Tax=Hexamita inflata TaxID=28002 RepID=A0ABP1H853_9EUKA